MRISQKIVAVLVFLFVFLVSCGGDNNATTAKKEEAAVTEKPKKPEMTVEKSVKLYFEATSLLMDKYWDKFKGKNYEDVKDLFAQYEKEKNAIYEKYGVSDKKEGMMGMQSYAYFDRDHIKELREYRKAHPEYDYWKQHPEKDPEYTDALNKLTEFELAAAKEK